MKKHNISRKLTLHKKTVSNLDSREMELAKGGEFGTLYRTCFSEIVDCRTDEFCSCIGTICT